jgi:hypothetical protein
MENDVIKIALALVVGITGIYCSYIISPYITKGLNEISEQVVGLPLPEEKETTKFIFVTLSLMVVLNIVSFLADVSLTDAIFCNTEYIVGIANPIIEETIKYTSSQFNIGNDQLFLNQLKPVTNFLNNDDLTKDLIKCLFMKIGNSSIYIDKKFFEYFFPLYTKYLPTVATISNERLTEIAPYLREYYLSKQLILDIDYGALMTKCNITSDAGMILTFLETLHRFGSGLGGVSANELTLRNGVIYNLINFNSEIFNGY